MAPSSSFITLAGRSTTAFPLQRLPACLGGNASNSAGLCSASPTLRQHHFETIEGYTLRYPRYSLSRRFCYLASRRSLNSNSKPNTQKESLQEQDVGSKGHHTRSSHVKGSTRSHQGQKLINWGRLKAVPVLPLTGACDDTRIRQPRQFANGPHGWSLLHTSANQQAAVSLESPHLTESSTQYASYGSDKALDIRTRLRQWQEEIGQHIQREAIDEIAFSNGWGPMTSGLHPVPRQEQHSSNAHNASDFALDTDESSEHQGLQTDLSVNVGDLVQLGTSFSSILGVKVKDGLVSSQFLTSGGRWTHFSSHGIPFRVQGWASKESIEALQAYIPPPALATDLAAKTLKEASIDVHAPRSLTGDLIRQMHQFHEDATAIYRENASVLDGAYESLAHPYDLRFGTLTSFASALLKVSPASVSNEMMFAVHQALLRQGFRFAHEPSSSRVSGFIQIRPKEMVRRTEQVMQLIREWQQDLTRSSSSLGRTGTKRHSQGSAIIEAFVAKARQIVKSSRQTRKPTDSGCIGPSTITHVMSPHDDAVHITKGVQFTSLEQNIIRFFEDWACYRMFDFSDDCASLPPAILEATGLYKDLNDGYKGQSTGYIFLQELGVIMPHHSYILDDPHLLLPTTNHSRPLRNLRDATVKLESQHEFVDTLADLRHDWGDLPVYCIDDASARAIDDGISIEPGPSHATDGDVWIHVHIANPTAFITQDNVLATMARHMAETFYVPDGNVTMLPDWASQQYWSLAPGRPCLSFSSLVTRDGRIIDTCIRPGIVNNVLRMTADEVLQAMHDEEQPMPDYRRLMVGERSPRLQAESSPTKAVPNSTMASDFEGLARVAKQRRRVRESRSLLTYTGTAPNITVATKWSEHGIPYDAIDHSTARSITGDPLITGVFSPASNVFNITTRHTARDMVLECMLLAGETASRWTEARNVPILHRSVRATSRRSRLELWQELCEPAIQRHGELPMHIGRRFIIDAGGQAITTTRPLKHPLLGLEAYSKVTSPLRRYGDMINHWQIQSALREEAKTGRSLLRDGGKSSQNFLSNNDAALLAIASNLSVREKAINNCKAGVSDHWICQLFFRALYFKQASLPETLTATVMSDERISGLRSTVYVHEFGISMRWAADAATRALDPKVGDIFEVAISKVDVYKRTIFVQLLRPIKRLE